MSPPLLEVQSVGKVFRQGILKKQELVALEDFSLTVESDRPSITTIAGESGSGKTTLASLVLGLLAPSSGQVLYKGKNVWEMTKEEWVTYRRDVQAIFQDPFEVYNPFYKVDHVLEMVVRNFHLAKEKADARRIISDALELLGLKPEDVLGKYPHQLSGGQRQRIMVARAFLSHPKLIVADEPVSMVDASLRALILENMLRLKNEFGISFLYITHDLSTAFQVSDNIYILYLGRVAEHGDVTKIIPDPQHPYTQLLVGSVPKADPDAYWEGRVELPLEDEIRRQSREQCLFAPRCPFVLPRCRQSRPPSYVVGPERYAACFLHEDKPIEVGRESLHPAIGS
jgi:peptide/nickel transport system ATP-binding protein